MGEPRQPLPPPSMVPFPVPTPVPAPTPAAAVPAQVFVDVDNSALAGLVGRLEGAIARGAEHPGGTVVAPPPPPARRPCSGNGMRYVLEETGMADLHCECFSGFKGVHCEMEDLVTPIVALSGNPTMLSGYWWDNQGATTVTTAQYRIGYDANNAPISGRISFGSNMEILETAIRDFHRFIGPCRPSRPSIRLSIRRPSVRLSSRLAESGPPAPPPPRCVLLAS
eukprot:SAG22_NODE_2513_length_2489_cov_3.750628_4_plen_224_part_00